MRLPGLAILSVGEGGSRIRGGGGTEHNQGATEEINKTTGHRPHLSGFSQLGLPRAPWSPLKAVTSL